MRGMKRLPACLLSLVPLLVAPFLAGCAGTAHATTVDNLRGTWQWSNLQLPMGMRIPTLRIDSNGSVSGCAGINWYAAELDTEALARGDWQLENLRPDESRFRTRTGTQPAMKAETDFASHLRSANRVGIDGNGQLVLFQDEFKLLVFRRTSR